MFRDGRLVYGCPAGARRERLPGAAYVRPFVGADEFAPAPGEHRELIFKMPRVPVPVAERQSFERNEAASYASRRERTIRSWKELLVKGAQFDLPEPRLNAAWRASPVHLVEIKSYEPSPSDTP